MSDKIFRQRLAYQTGEQISDFMDDRQMIYLGQNKSIIMAIANGKYTHGAVHCVDQSVVGESRIENYDAKNNVMQGMYYHRAKEGGFIPKQKYLVDLKNYTKTVFRDMHGNGISEISKLDPEDFSITETRKYNAAGNLKAIEPCWKNLRHGTCLYFYNDPKKPIGGGLSNVKKNLKVYEEYDQGFLMKGLEYSCGGQLEKKITSTKRSLEDDLVQSHAYENDHHIVHYYTNGYLYAKNTYMWDLPVNRVIYDELERPVYMEENAYEHRTYAVWNNAQIWDFELVKTNQYYPEEWDENNDAASGLMKQIVEGHVVESGPFVNVNGDYKHDGLHLFAADKVRLYEKGKVLEEYKEKIFEENGELIVAQNAPHQQDDKNASPDYSPA